MTSSNWHQKTCSQTKNSCVKAFGSPDRTLIPKNPRRGQFDPLMSSRVKYNLFKFFFSLNYHFVFDFLVVAQCLKRIDLGFALDTSGSIGNRTYQKVKAFVTDTLKHFTLSTAETHAAVIVYSTKPNLVIKLNEFYNLDIFSKALSSRTPWTRPFVSSWMNGFTRIDLALTLAKNKLFNSTNGDRPDVPNALIFLTDGEQNPAAPFPLEHYAQPLIKNKTLIIAVGFGKANTNELKKIASAPHYVLFYNETAEALQNATGDIVNRLCNCK